MRTILLCGCKPVDPNDDPESGEYGDCTGNEAPEPWTWFCQFDEREFRAFLETVEVVIIDVNLRYGSEDDGLDSALVEHFHHCKEKDEQEQEQEQEKVEPWCVRVKRTPRMTERERRKELRRQQRSQQQSQVPG